MPKTKKRPKVKVKQSKDTKTVSVKVNVNVGVNAVPSQQRRKSIKPRKRPNLRTMRNGMGGLTAANLKQPSFFGNTALLTNSAMAAMNNKAYSIERQLLDYTAEARAQLDVGRDVSQRTSSREKGGSRTSHSDRSLAPQK